MDEQCHDCKNTKSEEISYDKNMKQLSEKCTKQLQDCLEKGYQHVRENSRPDQSFRAMIDIMGKWVAYIEANKENKKFAPINGLSFITISRIEDIGRAREKLKTILDDDIFDTLSKHNPYWDSEYEVESDKLDDLRRKFSCFSETLWDLYGILHKEED